MASGIFPARKKPCGGSGVLRRLKPPAANSPSAALKGPQSSSTGTARLKREWCRAASGRQRLRTGRVLPSPTQPQGWRWRNTSLFAKPPLSAKGKVSQAMGAPPFSGLQAMPQRPPAVGLLPVGRNFRDAARKRWFAIRLETGKPLRSILWNQACCVRGSYGQL